VSAYWYSPWVNNANEFQVKQIRFADISFATQTAGTMSFSYGYDFQQDISSTTISMLSAGSTWNGTDTWDTSWIWGVVSQNMARVNLSGTRGNIFQFKLKNDTAHQLYVYSVDLALKTQATKEFTKD